MGGEIEMLGLTGKELQSVDEGSSVDRTVTVIRAFYILPRSTHKAHESQARQSTGLAFVSLVIGSESLGGSVAQSVDLTDH